MVPGVGKFGVESYLTCMMRKLNLLVVPRTEVVKGPMTVIGLYPTLFNNPNKGDILVFDDCDSILFDEVCLNMLKAVLDQARKELFGRSHAALRREGMPDRFDFAGGCIYSNVNFEERSKKTLKTLVH